MPSTVPRASVRCFTSLFRLRILRHWVEKLVQSLSASKWLSPHSNPEIELQIPRFNYVFFNTTRRRADHKLPLMTGSPAETPNSQQMGEGRWASRDENVTLESPKNNFSNKEQLPSIPHKRRPEAPRSRGEVPVKMPTGLRGRVLDQREILRYPEISNTERGPEKEQKIMSASRFPTNAPHTKLSSTGSVASNFQSFPHPSQFPAESAARQQPKCWLGRHSGEISNQR